MYVKPAPRKIEGMDLVVRDPDFKDLIPAEGRDVPDTDYWQRRLRDGDVVLADAPIVTIGVDVQRDGIKTQLRKSSAASD